MPVIPGLPGFGTRAEGVARRQRGGPTSPKTNSLQDLDKYSQLFFQYDYFAAVAFDVDERRRRLPEA